MLKLDLRIDKSGELALTLKIEGEATSGKVTVPVSFAITFRGDLEELVNTGIRMSTKKK